MYAKIIFFSLILLSIFPSPLLANTSLIDPEFSLNDASSLDDEEEEIEEIKQKESLHHVSALHHFLDKSHFTLRHELGSGLDEPGRIFMNRSSLRLQWEDLFLSHYYFLFDGKLSYNFAYHYVAYPDEVKRRYRFEDQIREFYLQSSFGKFSIKLGKQIVVWGEADGAVVTDVISPRDLTEFIFTPVEDARIGQLMLTTDYYSGFGQWILVVNPFPEENRLATPGHEYEYPYPSSQLHSNSLSDTEIGIRWTKTVEHSDLSLMGAYIVDDTPALKIEGIDQQGALIINPEYRRYYMVGTAANFSKGNFLWKGEAGFKLDRTFAGTDILTNNGLIKRTSFDTVLGLDYDANGAYSLTLEVSNQHILNWAEKISGIRRDESIMYATWSKNFLNETLTPQYIYVYQIQDTESMHRFRLIYDITDQWSCMAEIAYLNAWKKNSYFGYFQDKNRISFEIQYDF